MTRATRGESRVIDFMRVLRATGAPGQARELAWQRHRFLSVHRRHEPRRFDQTVVSHAQTSHECESHIRGTVEIAGRLLVSGRMTVATYSRARDLHVGRAG